MNKEFEKIKRLIKKSRTVLIATHIDPDGDAIGSMLALGLILRNLKKKVAFFCADPVPHVYQFLPSAEDIKKEIASNERFDAAFALDSSAINRIGDKINLRLMAKSLVNIDHHPDNTQFGDINYVRKVSSCAEEIFDLVRYLKIKISKEIADCLYVAVITDTGNFRYENTTAKTFLLAADLLRAGVSPSAISTSIYDRRKVSTVRLFAAAMSNIKFSSDHRLAWTIVSDEMMQKFGAEPEGLIGIIDHLRSIDGVEVAIIFREKQGKVKVNFRSKSVVNVSEIARKFGGGGHIRAAGAIIEGDIDKTEEMVVHEVTRLLAKT